MGLNVIMYWREQTLTEYDGTNDCNIPAVMGLNVIMSVSEHDAHKWP